MIEHVLEGHLDEETLRQHLENIFLLRRQCLRDEPDPISILNFLEVALGFVRLLMSEGVYRRAMKSAAEGEGPLLFANRVQLLKPLMGGNWPADFDFDELVNELFAVANGDAPRMLKGQGKQGKFSNAHALAEKKLDAHVWYKVLGRLGLKAAPRQNLISEHYNVADGAFQKWLQELKRKLGADHVDRYLVTAVRGSLSRASMQDDPVEWAIGQTALAGASYRAELARSAK